MYPSHTSRKLLAIVLIAGLLASAFLVLGKNNIQSATAHFSQGLNQTNIEAAEPGSQVQAASVQASMLDVRISAGSDDAEQRVSDGFMYLDSSDLELTNDPGVTKGNQSVGMRFNGITIPQGASIVQAYIEFQVDEASSEATSLVFHGQAADNSATFTTATSNISSRLKTSAVMSWDNIGAWNTVGAKVQTPDLSSVIQEIVNRPGWVSGNSMVIVVDGSGRRVASAYESGAQTAALLHLAYLPAGSTLTPTSLPPTSTSRPPTATSLPPTSTSLPPQPTNTPIATSQPGTINTRVSQKYDDAEQRLSDGHMYLTSSDLEMVDDPSVAKALQVVGMRFNGLNIPQGATITEAYIEFQVDEASNETTSLVFHGQATDNAAMFSSQNNNISSRPKTTSAMNWNNIAAWNTVGARVQSPDLSAVVQEIVDRPGWSAGNSLAIVVDGSGRRVASAFEAAAQAAPLLHVSFITGGGVTPTQPPPTPTKTTQPPTSTPVPSQTSIPPTATRTPTATQLPPTATNSPVPTGQPAVLDVRVTSGNDDAEQRVTDGFMYLNSSDLELTNDPGVAMANQTVGMRFSGVPIPKGALIVQAYLEFQVDEASSEATSLVFHGQATDNAGAFTSAMNDISLRTKTSAAVNWNNIAAWNTVGAKIQTPDLTSIIQEIVNRPGWSSGNSLAIIVDGSGRRVASAYESGTQTAALLHVVYFPIIMTPTPPTPPGATPTPTRTPVPPTPTRTPLPPTPTRTPLPTTSPTPNPSPTPVGQDGNWNMVFNDEFNGNSLDTTKWRTCFWWADVTCSIETNHELELYNPQDVLVQNGILRLRAQKRDMVAWNGVTYHYTSGMVMTGGRSGQINPEFSYTYGYAEARVWVPAGQGLWPAFWMLPVSYNSRPEIDIMEILGHQPTQYHMNYHYVGGDAGTTWTGPDFSAGWHVIGLDWTAQALVWYVDGVEVWRYTDAAHISNEPEYLLLNLAVGGDWPGPPNGNTPFPSYYDVDYVRVWQR